MGGGRDTEMEGGEAEGRKRDGGGRDRQTDRQTETDRDIARER